MIFVPVLVVFGVMNRLGELYEVCTGGRLQLMVHALIHISPGARSYCVSVATSIPVWVNCRHSKLLRRSVYYKKVQNIHEALNAVLLLVTENRSNK